MYDVLILQVEVPVSHIVTVGWMQHIFWAVLKAMSLQEQQGGDGPEVLGHTDFDDGLGNFEDDSPPLSGIFQRSNYPAHPSSPYYASMPGAGKCQTWRRLYDAQLELGESARDSKREDLMYYLAVQPGHP
jgi:hypothetical protein